MSPRRWQKATRSRTLTLNSIISPLHPGDAGGNIVPLEKTQPATLAVLQRVPRPLNLDHLVFPGPLTQRQQVGKPAAIFTGVEQHAFPDRQQVFTGNGASRRLYQLYPQVLPVHPATLVALVLSPQPRQFTRQVHACQLPLSLDQALLATGKKDCSYMSAGAAWNGLLNAPAAVQRSAPRRPARTSHSASCFPHSGLYASARSRHQPRSTPRFARIGSTAAALHRTGPVASAGGRPPACAAIAGQYAAPHRALLRTTAVPRSPGTGPEPARIRLPAPAPGLLSPSPGAVRSTGTGPARAAPGHAARVVSPVGYRCGTSGAGWYQNGVEKPAAHPPGPPCRADHRPPSAPTSDRPAPHRRGTRPGAPCD